jgi:hypothetical protein
MKSRTIGFIIIPTTLAFGCIAVVIAFFKVTSPPPSVVVLLPSQAELRAKQAQEERKASEEHRRASEAKERELGALHELKRKEVAKIDAENQELLINHKAERDKEAALLEAGRQKELVIRINTRQHELRALQEFLQNCKDNHSRLYLLSHATNNAAAEARARSYQEMATYKNLANDLERAVGESKEKDALRKQCQSARQQAIDDKKLAEDLVVSARQSERDVESAATEITKVEAAVRQAESDLRTMDDTINRH